MNPRSFLALSIVLSIFFGCEDAINQQKEPLTYQGKVVLEITPSFVLTDNGAMAKLNAPSAQIEEDPPDGTVYGLESDTNNVYLSQGSEMLPYGSWTDQIYEDVYSTTMYANTLISCEELTTITITDITPNCKYLNEFDDWVPIHEDATVTAKAVSTGPNGSATITTDSKILMGHGGDNG